MWIIFQKMILAVIQMWIIEKQHISCDSDVDNRETTINTSDTLRDLAVGY